MRTSRPASNGKDNLLPVFGKCRPMIQLDEVADKVKDRMKNELKHNVNRLNYEEIDGEIYVKLEEVENLIDDAG